MKKETLQKILKETEQGYDLIADKFSATRKSFWNELKFIKKYADENDKVLDFGCGNGRLLEILPKSIQYYGVDVSRELIKLARQKYNYLKPNQFVAFQKISSLETKLPYADNFFDVVYSIAVLHHLPDKTYRQKTIKELKRVLKADGYITITVWNLWQKKYFKNIFQNWQAKMLGKSQLDWNDAYISFTNNQGQVFQRYHHAFTKHSLKKMLIQAGFQVIELRKINHNYLIVGKKK